MIVLGIASAIIITTRHFETKPHSARWDFQHVAHCRGWACRIEGQPTPAVHRPPQAHARTSTNEHTGMRGAGFACACGAPIEKGCRANGGRY